MLVFDKSRVMNDSSHIPPFFDVARLVFIALVTGGKVGIWHRVFPSWAKRRFS